MHPYLTEQTKIQMSQFLNFRSVKTLQIPKWHETTRLGDIKQDKPLAGFLYPQVFTTIMLHIILQTCVWMLLIYPITLKGVAAVRQKVIHTALIQLIHQEEVLEMLIHIYLNMLKKIELTQINLTAKI